MEKSIKNRTGQYPTLREEFVRVFPKGNTSRAEIRGRHIPHKNAKRAVQKHFYRLIHAIHSLCLLFLGGVSGWLCFSWVLCYMLHSWACFPTIFTVATSSWETAPSPTSIHKPTIPSRWVIVTCCIFHHHFPQPSSTHHHRRRRRHYHHRHRHQNSPYACLFQTR